MRFLFNGFYQVISTFAVELEQQTKPNYRTDTSVESSKSTPKNTPRTVANHYHSLITLGLPIVVGQLGTILLSFADTMMVGHHSLQELAAAGLVNNIFALALIAYMGFSYGLTPIVGRLCGEDNIEGIGAKLRNSLYANLLAGVLFMAALFGFYFSLEHIGQPPELLPLIRPYLLINILSIPFVGVFNTLKQTFDGMTRTAVPMWAMMISNALNILFNWFLIYGVCGFPELGLLGAGISTVGSRVLMALILVAVMYKGKSFELVRHGFAKSAFSRTDFRQLNKLGWVISLQMGMETAAFSLSSILAGWLGAKSLAAHQVMMTVSQVFFMVYYGLAAALSIRVSIFVGSRDFTAVRRLVVNCAVLLGCVFVVVAIPVILLRSVIGSWFTSDAEVISMVSSLILVLIVYQVGDGMQILFANSLRGIAHVKPLVPMAFLAFFVISLPLGYVFAFPFHLGILGVWGAFPFGLTTAGVLYCLAFYRRVRQMEA